MLAEQLDLVTRNPDVDVAVVTFHAGVSLDRPAAGDPPSAVVVREHADGIVHCVRVPRAVEPDDFVVVHESHVTQAPEGSEERTQCLGLCLIMMDWAASGLSTDQRDFVASVLGDDVEFVSDMSWGQVDTRVLRVMSGATSFVVKAAGHGNHHIGREISAHETRTGPLLSRDLCGRLVAADRKSNALITTFVPGELVEGTPAELAPDVHAQAGALLRAFHGQSARLDDDYEARATDQALRRLGQDHRIARHVADRAREILVGYSPRPVLVVPTHGDWHPRNWVFDGTQVRVIDFGRFAYRPAATDLCRLAVQQWRSVPSLETAFMSGYVEDPRDPEVWSIDLVREAVGTAVWAYQVGDEPFEQQGHRMLLAAIERF